MGKRILASLFQSVTLRTAGFNTADLGAMNDSSKAIMILMMLIGGSPGSTAGGMKTTTIAVLILNAFATFGREPETEVFGRRFDNAVVKNAATIAILYFFLFFTGGIAISQIEHVALSDCLFETASAVGTAGLTLGITTELGLVITSDIGCFDVSWKSWRTDTYICCNFSKNPERSKKTA